jgi:hypothetical protein
MRASNDAERIELLKTRPVKVDYRYTREELQAISDLARAEDLEKRGRYDAMSGTLNIYRHPWNSPTMQEEITLVGPSYASSAEENRIFLRLNRSALCHFRVSFSVLLNSSFQDFRQPSR